MGDLDFGFTEEPRDRDEKGWFEADPGAEHMTRAKQRQGFQRPYDRSPVDTPRGWHGGRAENTGGHTIVRSWNTAGEHAMDTMHHERPGSKVEYKVSYGHEPTVFLEKYEWSGGWDRKGRGSYEFTGTVERARASNNTDRAKARKALELMRKHSDKTR